MAYLDEYYAVGDVPDLTASLFPFVRYTPVFLIGTMPSLLVIFSSSLSRSQLIALLSFSALTLVALMAWMGLMYIGIDLVYFKFQPV